MDNDNGLIEELHRENLCTYYILPLIKLNKMSFLNEKNFIDSYINKELTGIFVKVKSLTYIGHKMESHPNFKKIWVSHMGKYIEFSLAEEWDADMMLFSQGQYSKLSRKAKERIRTYSTLIFRMRDDNGEIVTDVRLLALEKSPGVKDMWERRLGCVFPEERELLSIPSERSYISWTDLQLQ